MADVAMSFAQAVGESIGLTVYGIPVTGLDLSATDARMYGIQTAGEEAVKFAKIKAFAFGTGRCARLPSPILLLVFGTGKPLTNEECGFQPGEVLKWQLPPDKHTIALDLARGTVEDLLEDYSIRGITGGIVLENPRYQGGKLCADIHAWAKISILGRSVRFDERIPVCIDLGQPCFTVWEIGWANIQVCYKDPKQICARLCVGKWGLERCWDAACVTIPFADAAIDGGEDCGCAK